LKPPKKKPGGMVWSSAASFEAAANRAGAGVRSAAATDSKDKTHGDHDSSPLKLVFETWKNNLFRHWTPSAGEPDRQEHRHRQEEEPRLPTARGGRPPCGGCAAK